MADQVKSPAKPVLKQTAMRANGADFLRTYHQVKVGPEITVQDVLRPGFWAHHAGVLRADDLIDILSEDGGLDMQVRVVGKGIGMVMVRPLRIWQDEARTVDGAADEADSSLSAPDGYTINFAPKQRWRVMTNNPHEVISKDHPTKAAAVAAALAHSAQANAA